MSSFDSNVVTDRVAILLCTFNGSAFLAAQLDSIVNQTHTNWVIYASDDGSTDNTLKILQDYQSDLGAERLIVLHGPRAGFANNFMSLVKNQKIAADYYAFSDQDDIWFSDKLARSLACLQACPVNVPAVSCSRTRLIDADGNVIGYSPLFSKKPSFRNALVQSLAGANTMLLNKAARALLARTHDNAQIVSHDWLTYLLVTGSGGMVVYEPAPTLDYRQHGANLIGSNSGISDRWVRLCKMLSGTFREWSEHNIQAISNFRLEFTPENRAALDCFKSARNAVLFRRLLLLRKAGVYRQTALGTIGLVVAASIRRI